MRYLVSVVVACLFPAHMFAQQVSNINFGEIEILSTDSTSEYYFPTLYKRFQEQDTTMTFKHYKFLYYGQAYSDQYNPVTVSETEKQFNEAFASENFSEAVTLGEAVLKEYAVNLGVVVKMFIAHQGLGDEDQVPVYIRQMSELITVIANSGDGESVNTAMVVMKLNDEFQVLAALGLSAESQNLIGGSVDQVILDTSVQESNANRKKIKELYFNVSRPMTELRENLQKKG